MALRLAFMGTPDFAAPCLVELAAAGHDIAAVYTQPPRPAGRGQAERKSLVHQTAETFGFEVRTPVNFKAEEDRAAFAALDLDVAVVVAYGLILPKAVLAAPRLGCLNLHASLLPRWRGAAPIQRAIMAGDDATGVQVMQMEAGLDTGPILLSETVPIRPDDTAGRLHDRLSLVGAQLAPRALAALERGGLDATPQAEDGVAYAEKIDKAEAKVDWTRPAAEVDRLIRGLSPFPGAWTLAGKDRLKLLECRPVEGAGAPGEILQAGPRLVAACGEGAVEILSAQRAGKSPQPVEELLRGFPLDVGATLG